MGFNGLSTASVKTAPECYGPMCGSSRQKDITSLHRVARACIRKVNLLRAERHGISKFEVFGYTLPTDIGVWPKVDDDEATLW